MPIFTEMYKNTYNVVGVMSGTSLDGIDLAYVAFEKGENWRFKILEAETVPYNGDWRRKLSEAISLDDTELAALNEEYTKFLSGVVSNFLRKYQITHLDAICSHGHTVKHRPEDAITLQIGNLPALARDIGETVICDFRVGDVELGGQGAPLVPIGDQLLFPEYEYCLNLGGFANISTTPNGVRLAYDICAVNTVLNFLCQKIDLPFDNNGEIAASGELDQELFERLQKIPFYGLRPPKSLGIEWVNENIYPLFEGYNSISSLLRTYTEHAAEEIANEFRDSSEEKVLITGGGAYNTFLIDEIRRRTSTEIVVPASEVINFKEALIFAFLGVLRLRGEVNVLSSVTGASKDHSSGNIFYSDRHNGN